jgi:alkylation response protein AidB-like acyl-CoA dehydrogenase
VDVGFSDSQTELRSAVRDVLARECPPQVLREAITDPDRWQPLWKTATDLGWPALALFDDGLSVIELVAVLEECGAAAAPIPLLSSAGLAGGVLRAAGGRAWQEELAAGAAGALGVSGAGARGLDLACRWDGKRLTGTVGPVAEAVRADLLVVLADAPDGVVAAVVRPGPGAVITPQEPIDPTRPLAHLDLDVVPESVLAVPPDALALPLTAAAAELVGVTSRLLDISVSYALTREQFDKPIGSFQGLKHRLADCYVALERARSLTYAAAMEVDNPEAEVHDRWRSALLAKAAASEAATDAARTAVQVHGAIAMTWEHDVHLYLRRAWQSAALLGESRALYAEAGALLVGAVHVDGG